MEQDFKDLLKAFSDEKVEYLVVGGYAVARYQDLADAEKLRLTLDRAPGALGGKTKR